MCTSACACASSVCADKNPAAERWFVTTLAGNGTLGDVDGTGGPKGTAEFYTPLSVAVDAAGNVYVADSDNCRVRRVDASGNVTTLAGNGTPGYVDGTGGPTGTAEFTYPVGVAVDAAGSVYVADRQEARIRKVDTSGNVTTLAGNGTQGYADGTGGPTGTAEFDAPTGLAVDAFGDVYVADYGNNRIRVVDASGNVTTLAGNGTQGRANGTGGPAGTAEFDGPAGVALDATGNVYVADSENALIRMVDTGGSVTTLAGTTPGFLDGTAGPTGTAQFDLPTGVAVDASGNVYVADTANNRIRLVVPGGDVTSLVGNGKPGYADGPAQSAELNTPEGVAVDVAGDVYVADSVGDRIREIEYGWSCCSAAGSAAPGGNCGTGCDCSSLICASQGVCCGSPGSGSAGGSCTTDCDCASLICAFQGVCCSGAGGGAADSSCATDCDCSSLICAAQGVCCVGVGSYVAGGSCTTDCACSSLRCASQGICCGDTPGTGQAGDLCNDDCDCAAFICASQGVCCSGPGGGQPGGSCSTDCDCAALICAFQGVCCSGPGGGQPGGGCSTDCDCAQLNCSANGTCCAVPGSGQPGSSCTTDCDCADEDCELGTC